MRRRRRKQEREKRSSLKKKKQIKCNASFFLWFPIPLSTSSPRIPPSQASTRTARLCCCGLISDWRSVSRVKSGPKVSRSRGCDRFVFFSIFLPRRDQRQVFPEGRGEELKHVARQDHRGRRARRRREARGPRSQRCRRRRRVHLASFFLFFFFSFLSRECFCFFFHFFHSSSVNRRRFCFGRARTQFLRAASLCPARAASVESCSCSISRCSAFFRSKRERRKQQEKHSLFFFFHCFSSSLFSRPPPPLFIVVVIMASSSATPEDHPLLIKPASLQTPSKALIPGTLSIARARGSWTPRDATAASPIHFPYASLTGALQRAKGKPMLRVPLATGPRVVVFESVEDTDQVVDLLTPLIAREQQGGGSSSGAASTATGTAAAPAKADAWSQAKRKLLDEDK